MMQRLFTWFRVWPVLLLLVFTAVQTGAAGECEDSGACTLPGGDCGAVCNGECLPFDEARCCMAGMCYRDGSWCNGVPYNGDCLSPDEARCLMSGCRYADGTCVCGSETGQ